MEDQERLTQALADRYRIEREIGSGGMATVYLAQDLKHDRKVAVKVLDPDLAESLGAERFLREIKTAANLTHPHILPVHDSGEAGGFLFYVMPYVKGESLRARLERDGRLPVPEAKGIATAIAQALDYAHRNGVIHRDIKPANILLEEGQPVLADFGIALAGGSPEATRLTQTGMALGTPAYMSPEQVSGEHIVDGRSDIYSLGCVLFEMVAGRPPFDAPSNQAISAKHLVEPVPSVRALRPEVPPELEFAITRALAKAPANRFEAAGRLAEALRPGDTPRPRRKRRGRVLGESPHITKFCPACDAALHPAARTCMYCGQDLRPWFKRGLPAAVGASVLLGVLALVLVPMAADLSSGRVPVAYSVEDFTGQGWPANEYVRVRGVSEEHVMAGYSIIPRFDLGPSQPLLDQIISGVDPHRFPIKIRRLCIRNDSPEMTDSLLVSAQVPGWLVGAAAVDTDLGGTPRTRGPVGTRQGDNSWEWRREGLPGQAGVDITLLWVPGVENPVGLLDQFPPDLQLQFLEKTFGQRDRNRLVVGTGAGALEAEASGDRGVCSSRSLPLLDILSRSEIPEDSLELLIREVSTPEGDPGDHTAVSGTGAVGAQEGRWGCDPSFPPDSTRWMYITGEYELSEPFGRIDAQGTICRHEDDWVVSGWDTWVSAPGDTLHFIMGSYLLLPDQTGFKIFNVITRGTGRFQSLEGYILSRNWFGPPGEEFRAEFEGIVWTSDSVS